MNSLTIIVSLAAFASVMLLVLAVWGVSTEKRQLAVERVSRHGQTGRARPIGTSTAFSGLLRERKALSRFASLDSLLSRSSYAGRQAQELARGDVPLRVGEYLLLRWLFALAGLGAVWLYTASPVFALATAAAGYYLPALYVKRKQAQRMRRFEDQLVDALTLIANALKSGYSFLQGIEVVAREMPAPISQEFAEVVQEVNVGGNMEEALVNLSERVRSYDLELAVTAMIIQRQVGGNLAEVLEAIAHTIRERMRILREVMTRTAAARLTGIILAVLPTAMAIILSVINPDYMQLLFNSALGQMALMAAVTMQITGYLVIRRIVDIKV